MMDGFRQDLGEPDLPLVMTGLGDRPLSGLYARRFAAWETIQAAQVTLRLANQTYVSAAGLPRNPDGLHLSTEGQAVLGGRFASAMVDAERDSR